MNAHKPKPSILLLLIYFVIQSTFNITLLIHPYHKLKSILILT
jgi:hypothetical protein